MSKSNRRKRVNRSASEKSELLRAYQASGETQAEFCNKRDISKTSFQKWLLQERKNIKMELPSTGPRLVELCSTLSKKDGELYNNVGSLSIKINFFSLIQLSYSRGVC